MAGAMPPRPTEADHFTTARRGGNVHAGSSAHPVIPKESDHGRNAAPSAKAALPRKKPSPPGSGNGITQLQKIAAQLYKSGNANA